MQPGFFDLEDRYRTLDKLGDPLPKLSRVVEWEGFRSILERVHQKERKSNAGRKPFDVVLMFKVLVLLHEWHQPQRLALSSCCRCPRNSSSPALSATSSFRIHGNLLA